MKRPLPYIDADISDLVPEADKLKADYLMANIDYTINTLVHPRQDLKDANDIYNGTHNLKHLEYLKQHYGMQSPADVRFIPLIRKHIQVLVGQQSTNPLNFKVTCGDPDSILSIKKAQTLTFVDLLNKRLVQAMNLNLSAAKAAQEQPQNQIAQLIGQQAIQNIQEYISTEWTSDFENAGQHLTNFYIFRLNLKKQFNEMMQDLLVYDRTHCRTWLEAEGQDPKFMFIPAEELFYDHPGNTGYISDDTQRIVHAFEMSRIDIINRWGHEMTKDELDYLGLKKNEKGGFSYEINRGDELDYARLDNSGMQHYYDKFKVYHVEWLANNSIETDGKVTDTEDEKFIPEIVERTKSKEITKRFRMNRYEGYRIGDKIYVGMGKSKFVLRDYDTPWKCPLSYDGRCLLHNGKVNSIPLTTKDLQDKYNIIHFYLENDLSFMLRKGITLYTPNIPQHFGKTVASRVAKAITYAKNGAMVNEPNVNDPRLSNMANASHAVGFELGTDPRVIDGHIKVLEFFEATASSITGVNRQALGQFEERDALGNTNIAMAQTALMTKPQFNMHLDLMCRALTNLLQLARLSYKKKGKRGSYPVGGDYNQEVFRVEPKHLLAYFNVFVVDGGMEQKDIDAIKQLAAKFADAGTVDPDILMDVITARSVSGARRRTRKAMKKAKDDAMKQLSQQLDDATKQLSQKDNEMQKLVAEIEGRKNQDLELQKRKLDIDERFKMGSLENDSMKNASKKETDERALDIEANQVVMDDSNKNDEPLNLKNA